MKECEGIMCREFTFADRVWVNGSSYSIFIPLTPPQYSKLQILTLAFYSYPLLQALVETTKEKLKTLAGRVTEGRIQKDFRQGMKIFHKQLAPNIMIPFSFPRSALQLRREVGLCARVGLSQKTPAVVVWSFCLQHSKTSGCVLVTIPPDTSLSQEADEATEAVQVGADHCHPLYSSTLHSCVLGDWGGRLHLACSTAVWM